MIVQAVHTSAERACLPHAGALPPFDAAQIQDHRPDLHLCVLSAAGEVEAHASLWWTEVPGYPPHKPGIVGHYASTGDEAASALLAEAIRTLREQGCTIAIGPMDGSTWRRYRFVVEPEHESRLEPPFFLEPANPAAWPLQWQRAGFTPLAHYISSVNSDLTQADTRVPRVAERMKRCDVRIRPARAAEIKSELSRIYRVSQVAFTRNFLYTELPESAYLAQYEKLLPHIRPEFLLLAERGADLVGFLFAIPDLAQAARGLPVDTFLLKTVAVLPDPELAGLGALLAARIQEFGREMGFRRCIHALMYENNVSRNTSRRYATVMRRYALFSRELAS